MKTLILSLALAGITSLTASAQTPTPAIGQKQVNQHERIKEGVDSGQLTKKEARHLRARQAKIRHDKRVARMDGVVTPAERKQLHKEQRRASRAIHRQKHDEQHR